MPDLKKMLTLEALSAALPSWLKRSTKPDYNADEIDTTLTVNQFVTASDKQNWNAKGTYSKPSGGIPKSDLTNAVQTSLGKADTALQSFTETDPTVPSWAKQTNKPSYTQDEVSDGSTYKRVSATEKTTWNNKGTYSKPSGGIPKTDLASAVQTSLGKADTALQSFTETDPTVPSWAKASSKPTYTASEVGAIATSAKGAASGVAELDSNGKVPSSQLPAYVDDVLEYSAKSSFPSTGETGKIYVDTSNNKTYRWSGSAYVEISESLALGETSSTAYYGDKGKTAYNHSQVTSGNPHNVTKSDVGLGNVGNFKAVSTVASQGLSSTEKSNARANIGAGTSSFSGSYNDLSNKPTLGTAAAKDVPSSGNASTSQVVMGNDSRLSDARTPTSHTHTKSQITDFPSSMAPTSHTHGNIQNGGTLQTNDITIASGDKLVVTDASDSNKVARTSASFDGSTTIQALTKKGTFETFPLAAYGTCDTAADVAAKVVTLASDSKFTLVPGSMVAVLATYTNTASNPTLNVNGTGAKPIVYGTAVIETTNLAYATYANRQHLFMYDGTNYIYLTHNVDNNSTYSNASLGQGYGTCTTAAATAAKVVTLSNYALATGGIVSVKFSYDVPASATMNINSKGAKAIYHRGAAITAGVIKAGDTATFIYSTYYHLISIDRDDNTSAVTGVKGYAESEFRTGNVNLTAANVGAVALTGNTITGDIQRKQTEIDASKANNNISATKYPTTYSIIDNSGRILVRNEAIVEPSGNISWYAYVRNYNTSGGQVAQKGIKYTVNKSGTGAWTVDDSASFKSAIGLSNIDSILSPIFNPAYIQPTKHSNITSIDDGGYIQIGKLTILNMRFTVGTACGQWTDIFTDCPLPLSSLSGGYGVVACSSNTDQAFAICANGRLQNYSGTLNPGSYVVSACYMTQ